MPGIIRNATIADVPLIHELAHFIWPQVYAEMISTSQIDYMLQLIYSHDALIEQISTKQHQFIIYEEEGVALAFASYSPKENDTTICRLHKLYVSPSLQGKGVGKLLVQHIAGAAKNAKAILLELNVNKQNVAISFYGKLGFKILKQEVIDIGGGYVMDDYIMGLELV